MSTCKHNYYFTGNMPCTGPQVCHKCGLRRDLVEDVAAYWSELTGPQAVVSRSHRTLRRLTSKYGADAVDQALQPHFNAD